MPTLAESPHTYQPSRTRTAQRRRRLTRAVARWSQVLELDHYRARRVAQITLTLADGDELAAQGRARAFWRKVNDTFGQQRYFCWLELQRSGRVHYHALWLNPPPVWRRDIVAWIQHTWAAGRTQVRFQDRAWLERRGTAYILGYAKKMGDKSYQQDYEEVPPQLRTFMNQRLGYDGGELDLHRDRPDCRFVPEAVVSGDQVAAHVVVLGTLHHTTPRGVCSLAGKKKARPEGTRTRLTRSHGVTGIRTLARS